MKLEDFSRSVHGTVLGDPEVEITGVSGIEDAREGDITFVSSPAYRKYLAGCKASCVIVKEPIEDLGIAQLLVPNPLYAFARAIEHFHPPEAPPPGISPGAFVSDGASVGKDVSILPLAYLSEGVSVGEGTVIFPGVFIGKGVSIGSACIIYPNVTIREGVRVGNRVVVHSGAVIGDDGFGYVFEKGEHYKIPQVGGVIIEDDVEIGSNVCIDRATLGQTVVGKGTKIDNLVQIAHNVRIGAHSLVVSQAGIAGSSEIGDFVTLGGQVGIADHAKIESGTMLGAQSGAMGYLTKGVYSGSPAIPHRNWLRAQALFARLPELQKRLHELQERVNILEKEREKDDDHK